jgi:SNF2 family DNA or RNA helicase
MKLRRIKKLATNALNDQEVIDLLDGAPEITRTEADFRPYQHWMSGLIDEKDAVLLGAEMGLGKTGAVLHRVRRLLDQGVVKKVLIVAPLYVADNSWPEDMRVWDFARALTYSRLTGGEEDRKAAALEDTEVHIVNRENLVWLVRFFGRRWPYDMLVYDEASRLKGGAAKTKPTQRKDGTFSVPKLSEFGALARVRIYFKKVVEMSGTPAPNGLIDLWGPAYILDGGERLGTKRTHFVRRWFREDRYSFKVEPFDHSEREIMGRLDDVMVSLREEDYLTLPPLVESNRWVVLPPAIMQQYKRFQRTMVLQEYDVEAVSAGVLTNKLLQFSNGSLYLDDKSAQPIHDLKLQALESIVAEAFGEPVLVAYQFKFDLERIRKRFPKFRVFGETKNDMRDWNLGRIPGMIVHPASASHGLNFQYGGNIAVWYGLTWSLELYRQFNKRLHRSGQKKDRVYMHHILARGTEDEHMLRALATKGSTQDSITDNVRVRMEQIMRSA